jgi:hypothetical protein
MFASITKDGGRQKQNTYQRKRIANSDPAPDDAPLKTNYELQNGLNYSFHLLGSIIAVLKKQRNEMLLKDILLENNIFWIN